jgi:hypothetical protein
MNLARIFAFTRYVEQQLADERERHGREVQALKAERDEWANKVLLLKGLQPLFHVPEPTKETPPPPPIGPTAKRAALASVKSPEPPSDEEIVAAAARAKAGTNGHA